MIRMKDGRTMRLDQMFDTIRTGKLIPDKHFVDYRMWKLKCHFDAWKSGKAKGYKSYGNGAKMYLDSDMVSNDYTLWKATICDMVLERR